MILILYTNSTFSLFTVNLEIQFAAGHFNRRGRPERRLRGTMNMPVLAIVIIIAFILVSYTKWKAPVPVKNSDSTSFTDNLMYVGLSLLMTAVVLTLARQIRNRWLYAVVLSLLLICLYLWLN